MANQIVTVNVTQTVAAAPSALLRTGALITQGGTTTASGTLTLLTQLSDLTPVLATTKSISSMSLSGGVVTVTTTSPHGWTNADVIPVTIAGVTPTAYNGNVTATVTGTSTFTYPLGGSPGSVTVQGTAILGAVAELVSMATTFFAQGSNVPVYVLELGEGIVSAGVTALSSFITANPALIYSYLVPREWDAAASFLTLLGAFNTTTSKTYFHITTTLGTYSNYTTLMKCALTTVQAPLAPATEFTAAAQFWVTLNYNPSSTNRVTPLAFSYVQAVTAYPQKGNAATLTALKAANVGYIGTGAEGGISNTVLFWGHTMDGNPFNYWYSVDWAQINIGQALANAVINGSNNSLNPLYYNQQGINVLQDVATAQVTNAVTYGLANGTVTQVELPVADFTANLQAGLYLGQLVVNAEPFLIYSGENPNDYAIGKYAGLACVYTPLRGFEQILFNLNVTNFIA